MNIKLKKQLIEIKTKNRKLIHFEISKDSKEDAILNEIASLIKDKKTILALTFKEISDKKAIELCAKIKQLCEIFDCSFAINFRADIAFLTCADALILDENSITKTQAEKIVTEETLIGFTKNGELIFEE
ncbi:MAG: thiamine phosphate synthase [bacterium]|nr:thiamine phosphate synthase [bacterium]